MTRTVSLGEEEVLVEQLPRPNVKKKRKSRSETASMGQNHLEHAVAGD